MRAWLLRAETERFLHLLVIIFHVGIASEDTLQALTD
jgi:hypothetical protein